MATSTTTPLAQASEALRCRFTDLAGLYVHPGGSQHRIDSLWWWVKFVYDHSTVRLTEGGSFKRVFYLREGHKSNRAAWIKSKAYLFALAYKFTEHWRACAERQPQPQQQEGSADPQAAPVLVKPDPEDQLLAWLDLLLLIAWKHMSTQTAKSRKGWLAFPFVTLMRPTTDESDPAAAIFSDYEYLGLTSVEEANGWELEWTEEGVVAFEHWSAREDEIKAMGSLRRRLIDNRTEAALLEARKVLDAAIGRGSARSARQSRATVIDLTAETVVKLSAEVGALREELSKLLEETKKQRKKRLRVKKEKKEKMEKKKEKEKENEEDAEDEEESDDGDRSDEEDDDDDDDDGNEEIEDEGDDQSQTTLSGKRKRQEEEKREKKSKSKKRKKDKKKKKRNNKKKAKKRRTDDEDEDEKREKMAESEEQAKEEEEEDDDGDDEERLGSLVRRRKRRARSLFEMRAGSCAQS